MGFLLYLLLSSAFIKHLVSGDRFLVTAPSVFHAGVEELVSVQVGESLLNKPVTCILEQEVKRVPMSDPKTVLISKKGEIKTLKLKINTADALSLISANGDAPYLNLVCDVGENKRQISRVLISPHRGYIFIQTDQPIYNPTQTVRYRIFTLDHAMKPKSDMIYIHIINSEGNTVKKMSFKVIDGIYTRTFHIPDVSQPGVWKIKAHYKGDEKSATFIEFKVQKFVLPSFGVSIHPEAGYLLLSSDNFKFSIGASYSYGKTINGGFHCRFGIRQNSDAIRFLRGLEIAGPVREGKAEVSLKMADIQEKLKPIIAQEQLPEDARFYIAVTVTDTISGEIQETEMFLPIISQRYRVDLSKTRSHFIPKVPLDIVVVVRTPTGQPAVDVPVKIKVSNTMEKSKDEKTNKEGTITSPFNLVQTPSSVTVEVTVEGVTSTKTVHQATSSSNSFLHISINNEVLSPGEALNVGFTTVNSVPEDKSIYYMVFSKGELVYYNSNEVGDLTKVQVQITAKMAPSFRLIGYFYHSSGDIIADSVWVDVKNVCEEKIELKEDRKTEHYTPGEFIGLKVDVGAQTKAKVALLAVDKAIYALNTQNKLTLKQVFSSMKSYDLGCSYGGGVNTAAVFNDAGLTFISHSNTIKSQMRKGFGCDTGFRRQKRAIDVQKELTKKESEFSNAELQKCCHHGLMLIPMPLTCEERRSRIILADNPECADVFFKCCQFAAKLRQQKRLEDIRSGHGRTASAGTIEDFFETEVQYIRQTFPPSFEFNEITVSGQSVHKIYVPDSITTWEIQAASLSSSHGFCVADPLDIRVFKPLFISLRLPYSIKRNEQLAIVAVIYNYGSGTRELAVHLKPADGLCSPGSQSSSSYINVTVAGSSSETVTFSAVPLKEGEIPIIVQLYDREMEWGVDAVQKTLRVMTEGVQMREETSYIVNLDGRTDKIFHIDGFFPNMTVPDSDTNLFVKLENKVFGVASAKPLLSQNKVESLIRAPHGCAEQTMIRMSPTALSIRYLDFTNTWVDLGPGARDTALQHLQKAYDRILTFRKDDGSYGAWKDYPSSNWLTALVVKVLSLVADCELAIEQNQHIVSQMVIRDAVNYLISIQNKDGSFTDPHPVIHREMQGGIGGVEQEVSLTAFITIALNRSLPFLDREIEQVKQSISQATKYLLSKAEDLQRTYAIAITAYCLSTCHKDQTQVLPIWKRLKSLAVQEGDCKVWKANEGIRLQGEKKNNLVPPAVALTVETTAYALLTALAIGDAQEAKSAACFLSSQENYEGGFKSTQDTIVALEALAEYSIYEPESGFSAISIHFTSTGRSQTEKMHLEKKDEKVEVELKRLLGGGDITAKLSGKGEAKIKVVKAYYDLDPFTKCDNLSIKVTVTGKVEYTAHIIENYDYYDYGDERVREIRGEEEDFPRSSVEWFDIRSRRRRDTPQRSDDTLLYKVCVSHSLKQKISGMAIADITLLSGFEPNTNDLDKLKDLTDKYISHYEVSQGRVLLYFNEILGCEVCVMFEAMQKVPIGLVQPAPATFYDYYEPDRRCSVFYAAPQRSKLVSVLCTEEVCQCAESGCFKEKKMLDSENTKEQRFRHACYQPVVDYGLLVTVISAKDESGFVIYSTTVDEVLKYNGKTDLNKGDVQIFAKRKHCRSKLEEGQEYLIMGNDGGIAATNGPRRYLLDGNTWVEPVPEKGKCKASINTKFCRELKEFRTEYQLNGCSH